MLEIPIEYKDELSPNTYKVFGNSSVFRCLF